MRLVADHETPREFLLFLVLLFEPVFKANEGGPIKLADLLKLKTACGYDSKTGELTRVVLTRVQGKRRILFSIEFSTLGSGVEDEGEDAEFATATRPGLLRLRVTAHPTGIEQLIRAGLDKLDADQDQDGFESGESDAGDESNDAHRSRAGSDRDVGAVSHAIGALAKQAVDRRQNRGSFAQWLVTKTLRDTLRLDVVGSFEQKDVEALATTPNDIARAWANGKIEPDFSAWARAANLSYEKARLYRKKVRAKHKIELGVPRAFYDGVTVAAAGAMDPNALRALASALAKGDPADVGRQLIEAAKGFAEGRRNVIGAAVQGALAGQLGQFPVQQVSAEVEALTARKKRVARKVAAKALRTTKQPGTKSNKPPPVKPRASGPNLRPIVAKEFKRGAMPTSKRSPKC